MSSLNDPNLRPSPGPSGPVSLQLMLYRHGRVLTLYVAHLMPPSLAVALDPTDVVQDVYLEAMRRSAEFRPNDEDHVRRWLKTIARRRVVDLLRHHEAAKRGGGAVGPGQGAGGSTVGLLEQMALYHRTPSQSAMQHEVFALVKRSLADLPDDYATVLRLVFIDGLSDKIVAARLARTEKSVHHLCKRAVEALQLRLRSSLSLG